MLTSANDLSTIAAVNKLIFLFVFLVLTACSPLQNSIAPNLQIWQSLNGTLPAHVPVTAIAVGPREPRKIFAATYDRVGVYTAPTDLGDWHPDNSGLPRAPAFALLAMPDEMFVGTASGLYRRTWSAGNWQRADPIPQVAIYALARDNAGALYVATDGRGIWKTDDSGTSWTRVKGLDDVSLLRILPLDAESIFAGTAGHGLFFTSDGGQTWSSMAQFDGAYINFIVRDPREPGTIYVAPRGGVYRSRDGGGTWEALGGGIEREIVHTLRIDPSRNRLLAGTSGHGIWVSEDEGTTWRELHNPDGKNSFIPGRAVLAITAEGKFVYAGTEDGIVSSSDDGMSWSPMDSRSKIGVPALSSVAFVPATDSLWIATQDGVYRGPPDWVRVPIRENDVSTTALAVAPNDSKRIYVGTDGKGVFVSTDAGASWSAAGGELGGRTRVAQLVVDPTNHEIVFARILFERIYKSTDGGDSWHTVWTGMPIEEQIQTMAIAPSDARIMYAGGDTQFFYSDNAGETWQARGLNGISTLALWIDPNDAKKVWAGATDGLYSSDDAGQSWRGPMLEGKTVSALARDASGTLFLGTKYNGVFTMTGSGNQFVSFGRGLENASVNDLALDDARGMILAMTGDGLFCARLEPPQSGAPIGESCR